MKAEQELRKSEGHLRGILDNMVDGVITIDEQGIIESFNPAAEKMFGYGAAEVVGTNVEILIPEDERKHHDGHIQAYLKTGTGKIIGIGPREVTGRRQDGTLFTLELAIGEVNLDGKRLFIGTARDVTRKHEAERELAEKSALLNATFENMSQGFSVYDADLKLAAFNQRFLELSGLPSDFEPLGMGHEEIIRHRAEYGVLGKDDVEEKIKFRIESIKEGKDRIRERLRPDGTVIVYHRKVLPSGGFVTTYTDITELRESERELAEKSALLNTTFENISQGFSVYDSDFKLVAFNQNYITLRGFPPGLIRLGMGYDDVIRFHAQRGEYSDGDIEDIVKTRMEQIRQTDDKEHIFQRTTPDGTVLSGRRNPMPGGGFVTTYTDITQPKKTEDALLQSEEQLKTHILELEDTRGRYEAQSEDLANLAEDVAVARDEAEAANKAKSEFLALMSHELRTPLNAVIGFSEIIMNEMFGAVGNLKYREYAHDVYDSGIHLLGLINDILDLSKIEAGGMKLEEEEVEAIEVTNASLAMVRGRAESGNVKLITDIAENMPNLYIDRRKLLQILVNLLSNAVKFTPEGGKVTIKVWCRADSGFVFQVKDTGIGIALEDIPKALSPFGQVDDPLGRLYEGTGLGLPLTKSLVEMNSGCLDLQSEIGKGTTITVRFPPERIMTAKKSSQSAAG